MSSLPTPSGLTPVANHRQSRLPRSVARSAAQIEQEALLSAVRLNAAGTVTGFAIQQVAALSQQEAAAAAAVPHAQGRLAALVDGYTAYAAKHLIKGGW